MARGHASSVINAPIEKVWARIRDFNGLPRWHPGIAKSEIEGGEPANQPGCIRVLTLKDGGVVRERLLEMSDMGHHYSYAILSSPLPVANYRATLRLRPDLRRQPHLRGVERDLRCRSAREEGGCREADRRWRVPGRLRRAEEALRRLAAGPPRRSSARRAMAGDALTVERVEVAFGATPVLKRISLAVAAGEFVALLGPSGCGKTTLLRAVSGFVPVSAGRISVGGRDITQRAARPARHGDGVPVLRALAAHDHGAEPRLRPQAAPRRPSPTSRRRVAEILAMLKLEGFGERNVTQLSGGQRQRVALGRALAISPELLLLDEPLSNLDARIREEVRHEIKALQAKLGITTIHVTHDREEAMVMADRIAILDAGRIAQLGSPEEVYNRPNSPFVASFMGAGNVLELEARPAGRRSRSQPARTTRPPAVRRLLARIGVHLAGWPAARRSPISAAKRRGSAPADARPADRLLLRGRIVQARIRAVFTATRSRWGRISSWWTIPGGSRSARWWESACRYLRCTSFRGGKHENQGCSY